MGRNPMGNNWYSDREFKKSQRAIYIYTGYMEVMNKHNPGTFPEENRNRLIQMMESEDEEMFTLAHTIITSKYHAFYKELQDGRYNERTTKTPHISE